MNSTTESTQPTNNDLNVFGLKKEQTDSISSKSLFGNTGPTPIVNAAPVKTTSFFSEVTKETNTPNSFFNHSTVEKKSGLFDNLIRANTLTDQPKSSFLSNEPVKTKSGLFDGLLNPSTSNNTGCGANLFGNTSTPLTGMFSKVGTGAEGEEDEEAVGGDEDEVPGQDLASDPTKSTGTYKYESLSENLFSDNILNFKADKGMGAGHLSVERLKSNKNIHLVFRNGAKIVLYQGILLPGMSKVELLKGRLDALSVDTGFFKDGKMNRQPVKIQFSDDKAAAHAKNTLEGLLFKSN